MDPTGTGLAIHYNKWRGVEIREIHNCFEALPEEAFAGVKKGDVLWQISEPYAHSAGKVYGYERIEVTNIRQTDHGIQVDYCGSVTNGRSTLKPRRLFTLSDTDGLAALVKEHGHKITHVHDPKHDKQLAIIRKGFEVAWDLKGLPQ